MRARAVILGLEAAQIEGALYDFASDSLDHPLQAFPAFFRSQWEQIRSCIMMGTYRPAPVRRVFIPKPDGSLRPLSVPTVLDRVIQQALAQMLTPLFEPELVM